MSGQGEVTGVVGTRAYRDVTRSPHGTLIRHRCCADWNILIKTNGINMTTQTGNISVITGLYNKAAYISFGHWDLHQHSAQLRFASVLARTERQMERTRSEFGLDDGDLHRCMSEGLVSPCILLLILVLVNHEWSRAGSFNTRWGAT